MAQIKEIYDYIDFLAPFESQADFDNSGLLLYKNDVEVKKVLLCLDITKAVVKEAKEKNCELIISHHPIIFSPLKSINYDSVTASLIKADISALCVHTNLDKAENIGVNVCLAKALKLHNIKLYKDEYLCIGELEKTLNSHEFAKYVKDSLSLKGARYTNSDTIKTVAVSSGAGSDAVTLKGKYNFDALVTGEIKHHHFLEASENNLCAVEAGHFNTEDIVINPLLSVLSNHFNDVTFIKSQSLYDEVEFV